MMNAALLTLMLTSQERTKVEGFDQSRLQAIGQRMKSFVDSGQVAGTAVLVLRHGKTVYFDVEGMANVEEKRPMAKDTIFQIMSMTKPLVAIAIVRCAEEGLLNLDDPIEKYLPSFKNLKVKGTPVERKVTIRHLLTHTGGFGSNDPAGLDDDAKRFLTLEEYIEMLSKESLIAQPGERISYSGPGFSTLGRIVEVASKQTLQDFCESEIFKPLGMKDTFFFAPKEKYGRIASPYVPADGGGWQLIDKNPYRIGAKFANGAGGLYSTLEDQGKLLTCICEGGKSHGYRLLSPAAVDAMTHVQTGTLQMDGSDAQGFGLGFSVVKSPVGQIALKPVGTFGHSGALGTDFWADKTRGIVAVFMSQGFDNTSDPRKAFNTMVNAAFEGP